ncbi:hypothetical protein [Flavobacterium sp.]|uniref:hypothetical protein n=1 Tax=Flavobacterium sp. TaxID=239 RepID=UPI00286D25AE|nr:hypothetical protein [Flavobacterium sp.]
MKKIVLLFIGSILLMSCGGDKKTNNSEASIVENENNDKYIIDIEGVFEKNDSLVVFYQRENYFNYDDPISVKIIGSPVMQKTSINLPEGIVVENVKITISTNKEQGSLTIKNISIKNNKLLVVDGDNGKHSEYFSTDESFSWDDVKSRYILNHDKKYPPSLIGKETLISLLVK